MSVEYNIISIGTLSHNLLWQESAPLRTQHATITLVSDGERRILIDPSLPENILQAKLNERTGQGLKSVTDVFCTTLRPDSRRGLEGDMLAHAKWFANATELEWYSQQLEAANETAERLDPQEASNITKEIKLLQRFTPAPDKFTEQICLYPLPGPTPGCAGLLLTPPTSTVVIAGPAVPTAQHVQRGIIWEQCADKDQAMTSLKDLLELADIIIPGFDNAMVSPRQWI
jgi:glyoxylase-like metal-dependent hydrolase (beta-lactamase superfamily II)